MLIGANAVLCRPVVFFPGVHSSVEGVIVRWGMFMYSKSVQVGDYVPQGVRLQERGRMVCSCVCV